jgi:AcrR family transcriptional regulator
MRRRKKPDLGVLLDRCLAAFVEAGTLDLSLDQLARKAGSSKRMLVHYFGGRENIEEQAIARLENRLRAQFAPEAFPPGATVQAVVSALWDRTTAPQSRGVLLLVMDLSRRAWSGSKRAKLFYAEQQKLWIELLMKYLPDRPAVEELLQVFQGAVLAFLVTGDRAPGSRALMRIMGIKDFLGTIAPEKKVLAAIRAEARKKGKDKLSLRQINREIRSYRRERLL